MAPQFDTSGTVPNLNANSLQNINPQALAQSLSVLGNFRLGNQGSPSDITNASQPNQMATQNRAALQALSGYEQQFSQQGGTGSILDRLKGVEAKIPIIGKLTGPGQFEQSRQNTAAIIAQGSNLPAATILTMLPDYGENPTSAQSKLSTLQTMLSGGYGASVQPAQLQVPGQQSFGGIGLNALQGINAATGSMGGGSAGLPSGLGEVGTSLSSLPEEALALL